MLNKVKLVGKVLSLKIKEEKELIVFFSLMVPNPSGSITILRCVSRREIAEKLKEGFQEGDIVEVQGYLMNEKGGKKREKNYLANKENIKKGIEIEHIEKERGEYENEKDLEKKSRQILTRVIDFKKLDLTFDELKKQVKEKKISSNEVELFGKIITEFENLGEKNSKLLSFKIFAGEGGSYPSFFCRAKGELITDFNKHLSKGSTVLLKGFLQTKKVVEEGEEMTRISAIICRGFTLFDSDTLEKIVHVVRDVEEIDFTKPKEREWTGE